jgi:predicted RNA binding protein YcfA (HicA-like mRNA interferase family)
MSPRLPRITAAEVVRALHRDGWSRSRQVGSHLVLRHPNRPSKVVVPMHAGETLAPKTLQTILDQAGLTVDALRELL